MKLNEQFAQRLEALGIRIPEILLPNNSVNLQKWSVVACDQYTSDHEYWQNIDATVGSAPSTLRLTLPEIYLESPDIAERISGIHQSMADYLARDLLQNQGECLIYVERTTTASGLRQGLVLAVDLERYSYAKDSTSLIRATEGTIVERIPPRLQIRRQALLEIPHIMILINDPDQTIIEAIAADSTNLTPSYNLELMAHGGHLKGFALKEPELLDKILKQLENLLENTKLNQKSLSPLFFAMGDGNHSLATAKALWEEIKLTEQARSGNLSGLVGHPARYALAEIVNIHSPGLRFEPIHRVIFTKFPQKFTAFLQSEPSIAAMDTISEANAQSLLAGSSGQEIAVFYDGNSYYSLNFLTKMGALPPALVDEFHQNYLKIDPQARIDFIHGWQDTKKLVGTAAVCFFVPVIARERLFSQVQTHGPLPRKAFSMGDAEEKRYYMEARRIQP